MAVNFKKWCSAALQNLARRRRAPAVRSRKPRAAESSLTFERLEEREVFAAATLDVNFGDDGVVSQPGYTWNAQAVQSDGKIVVAGTFDDAGDQQIAVMRLNANGSLDTTFGGGDGIVTAGLGSADDVGNDVAIDSQGRIVVAGTSSTGATAKQAIVVRLAANGALDSSFSGDGLQTIAMGSANGTGESLGIDGAGRILVAGSDATNNDGVVARLTSTGALDATYAGDGTFNYSNVLNSEGFQSIAVRADGSAVAVGQTSTLALLSSIRAVGITANGTLDTSFGSGGSTTTGLGVGTDGVEAEVRFDSQGRAVIGATASVAGLVSAAGVIRLEDDGDLDSTFSGDGIATVDVDLLNTAEVGLALDPLDNILLTGTGDEGIAIVKVDGQTGLLDALFGGDGLSLLDLGDGVVGTAIAVVDGGLSLLTSDGSVARILDGLGIGILEDLLEVDEGSPVGTVIGTLAPTGVPLGQVVDFLLSPEDQQNGIFSLVDGVLTLVGPLNFEDGPVQTITVLANNGLETVERTLEILVGNVAPELPVDIDDALNQVPIDAVAGSLVGVTVDAIDAVGGLVTYLLGQGSDPRFVIDPITGVITVATDAVFDTVGEVITLVVGVTDGLLTTLQEILITVVPAATGSNGLTVEGNVDGDAAVDVNEGAPVGTPVANLQGTGFPQGATLTYTLTNNSNGQFTIVGNQLRTAGAIDYEAGASRTVEVQVSDGTTTITRTIGVTVNNVAPSTPLDSNATANRVAVGAAAGTAVGITAVSTDPAGGAIAYSLTNDAGGRFVIDPTTGVVTVAQGATFAIADGSYNITVQASDGTASTTSNFTVLITSSVQGGPGTVDPGPDPVDPTVPALTITGTSGNDKIYIYYNRSGYYVKMNGVRSQTFSLPANGRIYVYGLAGNDVVKTSYKAPNSMVVFGGDGNDKITGGRGDDVLLGEAGNDSLAGRGGRDVLIGGTGVDTLVAAGTGSKTGDEGSLFVGATTDHDADLVALRAISAAWAANLDNSDATIRSYLNSNTVNADGVADRLKGTSKGIDWMFEFEANNVRLDRLSSFRSDDRVN